MTHTKEIQGYEDKYIITTSGRVKSVKTGKELKLTLSNTGYYVVNLSKNKKTTSCLVHRLVAKAFLPNPDNKPQVNHIDGNKLNNRVSNLEWVSHKENMAEAARLKLLGGHLDVRAQFSDEQACFIRELYSIGYSNDKLARMFNTKSQTISDIIKNDIYKNPPKEYLQYNHWQKYSPQVFKIIGSLLSNNFSCSQIAKLCNLNLTSVRNYYRKHYLPEKQKK